MTSLSLLQNNTDASISASTVGTAFLKSRGMFTSGYWYWLAIGALIGFIILFNILFVLSITYLNRKLHILIRTSIFHFLCDLFSYANQIPVFVAFASAQNAIVDEESSKKKKNSSIENGRVEMIENASSARQDISG